MRIAAEYMPTSAADLIQLITRMSVLVSKMPRAPVMAKGHAVFRMTIMRFADAPESMLRILVRRSQIATAVPTAVPRT